MAGERVREWVRALPNRFNRESDISIRTQNSGHTSVDGFTPSDNIGNNRPSGFFSHFRYSKNWRLVQQLFSSGGESRRSVLWQGPREGISTAANNRESILTAGTGLSGHTSVDGPTFSLPNRMSRNFSSRRPSETSDVGNVRQFLGGEERGSSPEHRLSEAGWYTEPIYDNNFSSLNPAFTGELTREESHRGNLGPTQESSPTEAHPVLTTTIGTAAEPLGSSHKGTTGKTETPSVDAGTSLQRAQPGETPPEPRPPPSHPPSQTTSPQPTGKSLGPAWQDDKQHGVDSLEQRSARAEDVGSTGPLGSASVAMSEGSYLSVSPLQRYDEARSLSRWKIVLIVIAVFMVLAVVAIVVGVCMPRFKDKHGKHDREPVDY